MLPTIPRATALRTAGTAATGLPAAALAIRSDPHVDVNAPGTLLTHATLTLLTWHPAVQHLIEAAGGRTETATTMSMPVEGRAANPNALAELVHRLNPAAWDHDPHDLEQLLGVRPPEHATRRTAAAITVTRTGRRATLKLTCTTPVHTPAGTPLVPGRPVRLTPTHMAEVVAAARKAGIVVTDADAHGRLSDLGWLLDRRLLLTSTPHAPGWVTADAGELTTSNVPELAPAQVAVAAARAARGQVAVAIDHHAQDVATLAGATPAAVPGLHPWQQEFVGRYLATSYGLVNALPPGIGKSACAAGAMAAQVAAGTIRHRGIVIAGASLLTQWTTELSRFHAAATVVVATSATDILTVRTAWDAPTPAVLVCTPEFAAGHVEELATLTIDDLVVDEATFLRGQSDRTRALWRLRERAGRAVALTGTPEDGGDRTLEALVAFTRARRDLFTGTSTVAAPLLDRCGPLVFTAPASLVTSVPGFTPEVVALELADGERAVQNNAHARVRAILDAATTPAQERRAAAKLRSELEAWRLGLTSPAALASSRYTLGTTLNGVALTSVKVTWAAQWVSQIAAQGRSTLVFADSVAALDDAVTAMRTAGVNAAALTSKVRPPARAKLVEQFQAGELAALAVTATGQLGLNLQAASAVVHLDVPTCAPMFTQRTARAARMGSTHERIDVAVPVLAASADVTWWAHASGARSGTDLLSLARELTA